MRFSEFTFAYFSPETLLPATSIVATITGILLMLGRGSFRYAIAVFKRGKRTPSRIAATSKPHAPICERAYEKTQTD
jgi:hypothetical protein